MRADFAIIDGIMKINYGIKQKTIIKADKKVLSCSAASIIAKVTRDELMIKYDKKYPWYNFKQHKGYGTKEHLARLKNMDLVRFTEKALIKVADKKNKDNSQNS